MRRTTGLLAATATTALVAGVALAPSAHGLTRPSSRPAVTDKHSAPAPCKPKFEIVANQKVGDAGDMTQAALEDVVETDNKHAYAVGVKATEDTLLKTETFTGLLDEGNGKKWTLNDDPGGSLENDFLFSIDATNNDNVWATGFTFDLSGNSKPRAVVLHKNGGGWHRVDVPHSKKTLTFSVVTTSPNDVYVGGLTLSGKAETEIPVVFHYNGKKWDRTLFPTLTGVGVASMTLAGNTIAAAFTNEVFGGDSKTPHSVVKYLKGSKWKTIKFAPSVGLTSLSGSSIHDLWAAAVDKSDDPLDAVFHHTKHWSKTAVPDNDVAALSERSSDPQGIWVAGASSATSQFGAVDVVRSSGVAPGSTTIPGDIYGFDGIDAHIPNRVLTVGASKDNDGTVRALIEQATC